MEPSGGNGGSLFGSLRRLGDSLLGLLHARLELATVELQEEKLRLVELLLRVAAVAVLALLALMTGTALLVVLFWERHPVLALAAITAVYGTAALFLWFGVKRRLDAAPPPFSETLAEFKKDADCLRGKD